MDRNRIWTLTLKGTNMVRLVRACGSKLVPFVKNTTAPGGQARKSLWIETVGTFNQSALAMVRLVRACGSKQWYQKLFFLPDGQARKSLWIETTGTINAVFCTSRSGS